MRFFPLTIIAIGLALLSAPSLSQAPGAAAKSASVQVNGAQLHYTEEGSGEPLLLIHGFGSCGADWGTIAEALAQKNRVIRIDMRGHGRSTNPAGAFSHAQSAEDIRALLDSLGIEKVRAIGFSSGGMTLLQLATRHPDRVERMVVIGATTHFGDQARKILTSVSYESLPPEVREHFVHCATRGDQQVRMLVGQFRAFGDSQDDMNLGAADLGRIKARTLIIHGDRDEFFPVEIPLAMHRGIRESALWIVPNGDHRPTAGSDERHFVAVVSEFFERE